MNPNDPHFFFQSKRFVETIYRKSLGNEGSWGNRRTLQLCGQRGPSPPPLLVLWAKINMLGKECIAHSTLSTRTVVLLLHPTSVPFLIYLCDKMYCTHLKKSLEGVADKKKSNILPMPQTWKALQPQLMAHPLYLAVQLRLHILFNKSNSIHIPHHLGKCHKLSQSCVPWQTPRYITELSVANHRKNISTPCFP